MNNQQQQQQQYTNQSEPIPPTLLYSKKEFFRMNQKVNAAAPSSNLMAMEGEANTGTTANVVNTRPFVPKLDTKGGVGGTAAPPSPIMTTHEKLISVPPSKSGNIKKVNDTMAGAAKKSVEYEANSLDLI